MECKRTTIKYIEGKSSDRDDITGVIVSVFDKSI
jgi:hypothetical protein